MTWNPEFTEHEIEQRFVFYTPPDAVIRAVNRRDNLWFSAATMAKVDAFA